MNLFKFVFAFAIILSAGANLNGASAANGLVKEAVCRRDEGTLTSIKTMIDAGAMGRNEAIDEATSAIRACVSSGNVGRQFLLSLAGPSIKIPYWLQAPSYKRGDQSDLYFEAAYLRNGAYNRLLIDVTYPQLVLLQSSRTDNSNPQNNDPVYTRMVAERINDRDCLGLPPLFYAANRNSLVSFKWMLDAGGDPNMLVPFLTAEPGVATEFISDKPISKDINGGGYALRDRFDCVATGPNPNLMQAYAERRELVPVWTYAIKNVDNARGQENISRNYSIMKAALAKVVSVPARTLADLIDNNQWKIEANNLDDLELVKILVSKGADLNAKTRRGSTPMAVFVKQGVNRDALQELLSLGAKL